MKKIAIIGAGLGGLSAAARLAAKGNEVHIFEKNPDAGGKASQFYEQGFRFDTGPSLLTMPYVLNELFNECGENLDDYLSLIKLETVCKYFFDDGTIINAYSEIEKFGKEISEKTIDDEQTLIEFFNYSKTIYDLTADLFLFKSPTNLKTLFNSKAIKTLLNIHKIDSFRTVHQAVSSFFKDKKLIQLFDRYATYNGSNPFEAPATLNIIPYVEYFPGSYLPAGGIYAITNSLKKLAEKKGVNFHFNAEVENIILENKTAVGVRVNHQYLFFDKIISNVDVNITFNKLLNEINTFESKRYKKLKPSLSAVVFYWAVDNQFPQLETHNIIFSEDYKKEFDQLTKQKIIPAEPTIYIYVSSKLNPDDAPIGKENWFVMINVPYDNGQSWTKEISDARKNVIDKINKVLSINIEQNILFEKILTPKELEEKTAAYRGSIYGISSDKRTSAFLRQQNKSRTIKNLYFCGGSAHPGGGIPLVILSGKIVSDIIQSEVK
ncbi:MAG: 1-hydroxycarotenoid 3,4-desaturase CrtD [Ignavibacterium sp.]|uniref:1-hydroxycarotenoid 3,4-desaturase CrtD n=1 Tax=Ignavibacterium sp. TaxID=2651167 RepID=UPI00404B7D59